MMPEPGDMDPRAEAIETLPPVSEDELDAIKAELASPGRADEQPTNAQAESAATDEQTGFQTWWWMLAVVAIAVTVSAIIWWAWDQRRREH